MSRSLVFDQRRRAAGVSEVVPREGVEAFRENPAAPTHGPRPAVPGDSPDRGWQSDRDALLEFAPETALPQSVEVPLRTPSPEPHREDTNAILQRELVRERVPEPSSSDVRTKPTNRVIELSIAAVVIAVAAIAIVLQLSRQSSIAQATPARTGLASFTSEPAGADVVVDGETRGTTPLTLALTPGAHAIELRKGTVSRALPVTITAGERMSQHLEFAVPAVASTGRIEVTSEPPGARVRVDGVIVGVTPTALPAVDAGDHEVQVSNAERSVLRKVAVTPGATAQVMVSMAATGPAAGWVTLRAPFEMQVFKDGELIGTTSAERLMLPAGVHTLLLVSDAYKLRRDLVVQVSAGKTAFTAVTIPNGTLSINALPWADVSIDGRPVGTTPLGNLSVPVGPHEIVWHHPQLGEQRRTVSVLGQGPTRVGIDLNK